MHLAFGGVIDLQGLAPAVIREEPHASDGGGEQPWPAFMVGVERPHPLGRRVDLCQPRKQRRNGAMVRPDQGLHNDRDGFAPLSGNVG